MKDISHISFFYKPIYGGQEVYINNLNKVLSKSSYNAKIYQRYLPGLESEDDIVMVKNYKLPSIFGVFNWHLFTIMLALFHKKKLENYKNSANCFTK